MFGKSKSKDVDLAASKIINGSLSANGEAEFFQSVEFKLIEVLAKEHCFDIDRLLTAPELNNRLS